jgi:hypothetical protein
MCIFYSYIWKILCINAYIFKGLLGYKNPVPTNDVYVAVNASLQQYKGMEAKDKN